MGHLARMQTLLFFFNAQALISLFVFSTRDGWVEIMQNGVDAVGIDQQVEHLLLLPLESTVEKQVCYNLESKGKLFVHT